jgi:hypothetical protein
VPNAVQHVIQTTAQASEASQTDVTGRRRRSNESRPSRLSVHVSPGERGHDAMARTLLNSTNVNVVVEDTCGCTALQLSVFNHYGDVERLLLAYGAPVTADFYGLQNLFRSEISP